MRTSAAFTFLSYKFTKVEIDMGIFSDEEPMELNFTPSGIYNQKKQLYTLNFGFLASQGEGETPVVKIECEAVFKFKDTVDFENIPDFFYPNCLAIVFPYVRAYVSSVTLQANTGNSILIPTLNLMGLQNVLKEKTTIA